MSDTLHTEIIGFRQWRVGEELELRSGHMDDGWNVGVNTATCKVYNDPYDDARKPCEDCPGSDCECGLYALHAPSFWYGKDSDRGNSWASYYTMFGAERPIYVAGLVAAWGRVQVHHTGFRAQHAQVVALAIPDRKRDAVLARACAAEYGVPTVPQDELERVASEFGSLVPEDLRPARPRMRPGVTVVSGAQTGAYLSAGSYITSIVGPGGSLSGSWEKAVQQQAKKEKKAAKRAAREQGAGYDPRAFMPKRKGGLR